MSKGSSLELSNGPHCHTGGEEHYGRTRPRQFQERNQGPSVATLNPGPLIHISSDSAYHNPTIELNPHPTNHQQPLQPIRGISDTSLVSATSQLSPEMTSSSSNILHSPYSNQQNHYAGLSGIQDTAVVTSISFELGGNMSDMKGGMFEAQTPFDAQNYGGEPISLQTERNADPYPSVHAPGESVL